MIRKRIFVLGLLLLTTVKPLLAKDFQIAQLGFYGSVVSNPYPTIFGVGPSLTLFDFIRFEAGFGIGNIAAAIGAVATYNWGAGVKIKIPTLSISPVMGATVSRNRVDESVWGREPYIDNFATLEAAIEVKTKSFYVGVGAAAPYKKHSDGIYRSEVLVLESPKGGITRLSILPVFYAGFLF